MWRVDLSPDPASESAAYTWLDSTERASWRRYTPTPRRRFALCRTALRANLCDRLRCANDELSFGESRHGKPFAIVRGTRAQISFNVSHSQSIGLIAVGDAGRVGVDIEEHAPQRNLDLLIDEVMGPDEKARLALKNGSEKLRLFYRIWTFKEALTKALGTGLTTDVSQFQVPLGLVDGGRSGILRCPSLSGVTWALEDIGNDSFAAALAHELPASSQGNHSSSSTKSRDA